MMLNISNSVQYASSWNETTAIGRTEVLQQLQKIQLCEKLNLHNQ